MSTVSMTGSGSMVVGQTDLLRNSKNAQRLPLEHKWNKALLSYYNRIHVKIGSDGVRNDWMTSLSPFHLCLFVIIKLLAEC